VQLAEVTYDGKPAAAYVHIPLVGDGADATRKKGLAINNGKIPCLMFMEPIFYMSRGILGEF
jgi:hypothetical protein